ncbi:MAG: DUF2293 domain-containing protein [Bacillota bacterium]
MDARKLQDKDLTGEHLRVYPPRSDEVEAIEGEASDADLWWTPQHGIVRTPPGWAFLPRGDAFVTRKVKEAGLYWEVVRSRPKRRYTERLGLLAPQSHIAEAERQAQQTEAARQRRRAASARARESAEQRYRQELERAIIQFLSFDAAHADLAQQIARKAAIHAAEVGSGRVGRTRKLSLQDKAELAARAYIRHAYTSYERKLDRLPYADSELYRYVKAEAQAEVDAFIERHRRPPRRLKAKR